MDLTLPSSSPIPLPSSETDSMDSKVAASSPILEPSPELNNGIDKNSSSSSKDSTDDVTSFGTGQEEFEPESGNPGSAETLIVEESSGDPIDGLSENSIPVVESSKKSDASVNDDVENLNTGEDSVSGDFLVGVGVAVEGESKEHRGVDEFGGTEKVKFSSVVPEVTGTDGFVNDSEVIVPTVNNDGNEALKSVSLDDGGVYYGVGDKEMEEIKVNGSEESGEVEKDKASENENIATLQNDEQVSQKAKENEVDGLNVKLNGDVESGEVEVSEVQVMETLPEAENIAEKSEAVEPIESKVGSEESGDIEKVKVSESEIIVILKNDEQVAQKPKESDVDGLNVKVNEGVVESGQVEALEGEVVETLKDADNVAEKTEAVEPVESPIESKVQEHDLKLTSVGDSIVESIKVDIPVPEGGVAIVGEVKDESMPPEGIDALSLDANTLANGNSVKNEGVEEMFESRVDDENNKTPEPTPHDNNEASESLVTMVGNDDHIILEKVEDGSDGMGSALKSNNTETNLEEGINHETLSEAKENGTMTKSITDAEYKASDAETFDTKNEFAHGSKADQVKSIVFDESHHQKSAEGESVVRQEEILEAEEKLYNQNEEADSEQSLSDGEIEEIFGNSETAKHFVEELEQQSGSEMHSGAGRYDYDPQKFDGRIVTDSDEDQDTDEEGDGREMFESAALAALLKAATGAEADGGNINITATSQDKSRIFSVERPAGLGSSIRSLRPAPRPNNSNIYNPTTTVALNQESDNNISEEEKKKLEKLQDLRVKFLRLINRLGLSTDEPIAAQVLYRLALVGGRQSTQLFSIDAAKSMAVQLEEAGKDDLDFALNIMVIGKCGVGKSATINSIIGEDKTRIDAFEPATTSVKEISGYVDGVKIRIFDTPGLRSSVMEQAFNRKVLSSVKKLTKKSPPDIILYVDRLDAVTRDLNDLPMMKTITNTLGTSIWRSTIVTLTHAASAPPDGPSGSPLSYEVFVTQRSHVVQQSIGQAVADMRMMSPSLMNPVSLVENHPSCRKNRDGQKILPNGQSWKPQLLLLCYSMKILSEANSISKPQDPFDHRKLFGFRARSPPLPYMLSSMLQSHPHPKLSTEQDNVDSDIDLDEFSDIDDEEEDEYDQLPSFKPLKKAQLARLSNEQKKAYYEEYDYRVKLLQKKQWKEELRRMRETKKRGKDAAMDYGLAEEDADSGAAAPVAVPLPDMALPPSFDSDNPAHRYRFLEPTSQFLARPVLDTHGWDHDVGYDGVNFEHNLAIASRFPASYTIQITKDKKDFTINVDSAVSAKHGENSSSMAGFDVQNIGKQLAYIVRGETKFKNLKRNKTTGGISVTFLGENVVPGVKVEDQIVLGKQYALTGSAGAVRSQNDTAYGANFELQRREQDYPIGQVQSTFSLSVIKWRGDLALGFNSLAQFSLGRNSKVTVRAGLNNKLSGQISVKTSSSEHMSLALAAILPTALAIYRKFRPEVSDRYMY